MADIKEVDGNLDTLAANVGELVREVGILVARGPGLVTQAQLDALNDKVKLVAQIAKDADPNPGA